MNYQILTWEIDGGLVPSENTKVSTRVPDWRDPYFYMVEYIDKGDIAGGPKELAGPFPDESMARRALVSYMGTIQSDVRLVKCMVGLTGNYRPVEVILYIKEDT